MKKNIIRSTSKSSKRFLWAVFQMEKLNKSNGFNKHSIWCSQVNYTVAEVKIIIAFLTHHLMIAHKSKQMGSENRNYTIFTGNIVF